ncbi:MAG: hypothetical protein ACLRIS_14055 [Flavonifractor plautii]
MEQTLLNEIVARVAAKLAEAEGARPLRPPRPGMTGRACCCSARR